MTRGIDGACIPTTGRPDSCAWTRSSPPATHTSSRSTASPHHRPVELLLFECEAPDHVEQVVTAHIEAKVHALLAHESQFVSTHGISGEDDGANLAAFRARVFEKCRAAGRRAGLPYGEAFKRVERV